MDDIVVRISEEYWNEYGPELLKDQESFDNQYIQFIKDNDIPYDCVINLQTHPIPLDEKRIIQDYHMNYIHRIILLSLLKIN